MNDNEYYKSCDHCGRPMIYCKGRCCGKQKGCECHEYGPKVCGAIRPGEPKCPYQAVIPSLTVENISNLRDLADVFVHVSDINTTFYIDDKHRTIVTWAGPVEYNNYDLDANPLGLRSQFLIDGTNEYAAYYDKTGAYQKFNFSDGSEDAPISLTLTSYDETVELWDWAAGGLEVDSFGSIDSLPMERTQLSTFAVPSPIFTNDETGEELTAEGVYNLIESGARVFLNAIPFVSHRVTSVTRHNQDIVARYDGINAFSLLNARVFRPNPEDPEEPGLFDVYRYTAPAAVYMNRSTEPYIGEYRSGVSVVKTFGSSDEPTYSFEVPGTYTVRTDAPT